mgnify:CR=1 FL=1
MLLAYHDVADGGLFATLAEMAFASRCGLDVTLDCASRRMRLPALFAEELGAVVQVRARRRRRVACMRRATPDSPPRSSARPSRRRPHAHHAHGDAVAHRRVARSTCIARGRRRRTRCSVMRDHPDVGRAGDTRAFSTRPIRALAALDVRSGRRHRRAVHRDRRASARRDPARAGRQRPGRDGGRVRPRRLRRIRRAHDATSLAGRRSLAEFTGFVAVRRILLRRRARRGRGLGEVDPVQRASCATTSRHSSRAATLSRSACATAAR